LASSRRFSDARQSKSRASAVIRIARSLPSVWRLDPVLDAAQPATIALSTPLGFTRVPHVRSRDYCTRRCDP
jgi:hypothetical protein